MKSFVLFGLIGLVSAKPAYPFAPLTYATLTLPRAQVGINAETFDNPEIVLARTQHTTARLDQRVHLAGNEAVRLTASQVQPLQRQSSLFVDDGISILTPPAPLGADGRVVDTAEVAAAKAAHAAAHVNERLNLANEAARSGGGALESSEVTDSAVTTSETVGEFDGISGTSEVTAARDAHVNDKIDLANEAARSGDVLKRINVDNDPVIPLLLQNGIVAALVPVDAVDGRPLDTSQVVARGRQNPTSGAKSVDALAVAGPILAYGRLVY